MIYELLLVLHGYLGGLFMGGDLQVGVAALSPSSGPAQHPSSSFSSHAGVPRAAAIPEPEQGRPPDLHLLPGHALRPPA